MLLQPLTAFTQNACTSSSHLSRKPDREMTLFSRLHRFLAMIIAYLQNQRPIRRKSVRAHTRYLAALAFALGFAAIDSAYAQSTATICKDGTTSTASGKGTCSGHGGVSKK